MAEAAPLDHRRMALVLSGGGVRALAQLGVVRVLARYGLRPDVVVGTSGGAVVAALYASGWSPEELVALAATYRKRSRVLADFNWPGLWRALLRFRLAPFTGLIKGERLERELARHLGGADSFPALARRPGGLPLMVTAVDLEDGTPVVFCDPVYVRAARDPVTGEYAGYRVCGRVPVARAVRASVSIPGIFVPVPCLSACADRERCQKGRSTAADRFVDGGVREYLPVAVAVQLARAGLVFGVNLGYAGLRREGVADRGLAEVVSQSLDIMGLDQVEDTLQSELVTQARVVVLNPLIYDVGTFELEYLPELVSRGERLAEEFCRSRGLVLGGSPAENRRRLFPAQPETVHYPAKGSEAYTRWLRQIKEEKR